MIRNKIDPIIAVKDVDASVRWYQTLFDLQNTHGGGNHFAVLETIEGEILLCLHQWGVHEHATMNETNIPAGNGLILYFKTDHLSKIREKALAMGWFIEEEIHQNPNSLKMEFALRDPDGYYIIISEYHKYEA